MRDWRRALASAIAVAATLAVLPQAASASIGPSLSLSQGAGARAAGTHDLGMTINFDPSSANDTPKTLQIALAPGLIANADIDGGRCLEATANRASCEVGTGTATASAIVVPGTAITPPITAPATIDLTYYLVAPPKSGDLAGLSVSGQIKILGILPLTTISLGTGDVALRPSGDPHGLGLTISLSLPRQAAGFRSSVSSITSTFHGLRYPSTCPSTPARVGISATSYGDSTAKSASAPLAVTGCGSAPYRPTFVLGATRDANDPQVKLTTRISQAANELTSRSTALAFPSKVLAPNLGVAAALCPAAGSSCQPIGSATAVSPLYPTPLTGVAYLTGSSVLTPDITLVFGPPFSLTLRGAVSLAHNSTTFSGLPDIPLSKLAVTLNGGAEGAFSSTCSGAAGTATAKLVSQNGDRAVEDSSKFTIAGWKACANGGGGASGGGGSGGGGSGSGGGAGGGGNSGGGGGGGGGNGGGNGGGGSNSSRHHRPTLSGGALSDRQGHPGVRFVVRKGRGEARIAAVTVGLGHGLSFIARHRHGRVMINGVEIGGATVKSLTLSHGRLAIRLARPANRITLTLGRGALHESSHRRRAAGRHGLEGVQVKVTVRDANGVVSKLHLRIGRPAPAG